MVYVWHFGYGHRYDDVRIVEKECRALVTTGDFSVQYITSDKTNNTHLMKEHTILGVKIKILPLKQKRVVRLFYYLRDLKREIKTERQDIDICHIHEIVLWPLIPCMKRWDLKVIMDLHEDDVHDYTRRIISKFNKLPYHMVKGLLASYEKKCVRKADAVITVSPSIARRVVPYAKLHAMIPNFPMITNIEQKLRVYDEYKKCVNILCFAGGISSIWSQETILSIIEELDVEYFLAGVGEDTYMEQLCGMEAWEQKVRYLGRLGHNEVFEMYKQAGIGMALISKDVFSDEIREEGTLGNTKLFEFMLYGLPVICTNVSIWKNIVEENECGIAVNPEDPNEIKQAIEYLIANPEIAYEMGRRGHEAVIKKYNWEADEKKLLNIYTGVNN